MVLRLLNQRPLRNRRDRSHTHSWNSVDILTSGFARLNKHSNRKILQTNSHPVTHYRAL